MFGMGFSRDGLRTVAGRLRRGGPNGVLAKTPIARTYEDEARIRTSRQKKMSTAASPRNPPAHVIELSLLHGTLRPLQLLERRVNEYTASWSDARRVEAAFGEDEEAPPSAGEARRFGTLGRDLWRERSLAWSLRLSADVHAEDAERIVADLSAASRPLCAD